MYFAKCTDIAILAVFGSARFIGYGSIFYLLGIGGVPAALFNDIPISFILRL
jgi:hypothetical protein